MRLTWEYPHGDEAMLLFTWCAEHWGMPFYAGQRVLEVGAAETDFHERIAALGLDYTGIDARPTPHALTADVLGWEPDEPFDWVILLGTLEHIGLGYYGDAEDEQGDRLALRRCASWLRPGGMLWADVPYNPTFEVSRDRHYRVYDEDALRERLSPSSLVELARMYAPNGPKPGFVPYPRPEEPGNPFHFVSRWFVKRPDSRQADNAT